MEDIIDIIVTETTNLIEITSQPTDEVIDVNIIDNREDITLNVTPSVVEININSLTSNFGVEWGDITGTLSNQTDLNTALSLKADLVDGKVPSSQLPSYVDDVVEVANYASLPATGEVGKIYITLDTNFIYRWTGSTYVEIKDSSAVWGAITGTLSNQIDLQDALNAKVPYTGATANVDLGEYSLSAEYLAIDTDTTHVTNVGEIVWNSIDGTFNMGLLNGVTLQAGQELHFYGKAVGAIGNGQAVMFAGAEGDHALMTLADATTINANPEYFIGIATQDFSNNDFGYVTVLGNVRGLDTTSYTLGSILYYDSTSSTDGLLTSTEPTAPNAKILVAAVLRVHATQGILLVRPHTMPRMQDIQDVNISSIANNEVLAWDTNRFENKSIPTILGYTPVQGTGDTGYYARWTSAGVLSDGFIQTLSNITYVDGLGLSTGNGLEITGSFGGGTDGLKLKSYDETTGKAYMEFFNTSGNFRLGLEGSTGGGILPGSTAYATVLTTGLTAKNLEFGTNNTKRLTLDGTNGNATFESSVGIGTSSLTGYNLRINKNITGATAATNFYSDGIIQSDVTGTVIINSSFPSTVAASFTLSNLYHYVANFNSLGAGSTINTQVGFRVSPSMSGAGSNFGFRGQLASATNTWNIYMDGTANNHLAGNLLIGSTANNGSKLQVTGAATFSSSVAVGTNLTVGSASGGVSAPTNILMDGTYRTGGAAFDALKLYLYKSSTETYGLGLGDLSDLQYWAGTTSTGVHRFFTSQTERMRITSGGSLLVGTTSDNGNGIMQVNGNVTFAGNITNFGTGTGTYTRGVWYYNSSDGIIFDNARTTDSSDGTGRTVYFTWRGGPTYGGGVQLQHGTNAWAAYTSDARLKTIVANVDNGLEAIMKLNPIKYKWTKELETSKTVLGFTAQNVGEAIPEAMFKSWKDEELGDVLSYYQEYLTPYLVKAIQELKAELDTLKNK
jgi:hypothetical protein